MSIQSLAEQSLKRHGSLIFDPFVVVFVAIPFLLGIGVDDGVHLVARLREGSGIAETGDAVVRTSVTTILGFGSLLFAATPGLSSLGFIAALGVSCCLCTSLLVLVPLWSPRPR